MADPLVWGSKYFTGFLSIFRKVRQDQNHLVEELIQWKAECSIRSKGDNISFQWEMWLDTAKEMYACRQHLCKLYNLQVTRCSYHWNGRPPPPHRFFLNLKFASQSAMKPWTMLLLAGEMKILYNFGPNQNYFSILKFSCFPISVLKRI